MGLLAWLFGRKSEDKSIAHLTGHGTFSIDTKPHLSSRNGASDHSGHITLAFLPKHNVCLIARWTYGLSG